MPPNGMQGSPLEATTDVVVIVRADITVASAKAAVKPMGIAILLNRGNIVEPPLST